MPNKYDLLPERIRESLVREWALPIADELQHSLDALEEQQDLTAEEMITLIKEVAQVLLIQYADDLEWYGVPEAQIPAVQRYQELVMEQLSLW